MRAPAMRAPSMGMRAPAMRSGVGASAFAGNRGVMNSAVAGRAGFGARAPINSLGGATRSFGNTGIANRGIGNTNIANRGIGNTSIMNRGIGNTGIANRGIGNTNIANRGIGNTGIANRGIGNTNIANRGIGNTGIANRGIGNTNIANRGIGNTNIAGNRNFGNQVNIGGNRVNTINQASFVSNRGNFNRGGFGGGNFGFRSFGGFGGRFGLGFNRFGFFGLGGYGFGFGGLGFNSGFGLGLLLGSGFGGFGYGGYGGYGGYSNWGYPVYGSYGDSYYNPYLTAGYSTQPYDYSQMIDASATAPPQSTADQSLALFGQARDSFKSGDVTLALQQADSALLQNPNDTSLHEFRALCLFALARYDEAAVPLYAVLAIGPGWDWASLISLYPNVETYTAQLRRLEAFTSANPQSSAGHFVLAYHYLTEGFNDSAATQLKQVVAIKPTDAVATKMLQQMNAADGGQGDNQPPQSPQPGASPTASPAPLNLNTTVPDGATIAGTWAAKPDANTSVSLTIQPDGAFQWNLDLKGQAKQFTGTATFANGILTLVPENIPPIVGRVSWTDANHMTFHAVGENAQAPGLSFSKP
jgi:Tetratricopeptide repeat